MSPSPILDLAGAYELHPQVALRAEPFGALAYHYGNRRLTFLRSSGLVELVRSLAAHATLEAALAASGLAASPEPAGTSATGPAAGSRSQTLAALGRLLESEVIRAR